jgi:hypothetical protein
LTQPTSIGFIGDTIPGTMPIQLRHGWNYVPYLLQNPVFANIALSNISSYVLILKNDNNERYIPSLGINDLEKGTSNEGMMLSGRGYLLYVTQACTLIYQQ